MSKQLDKVREQTFYRQIVRHLGNSMSLLSGARVHTAIDPADNGTAARTSYYESYTNKLMGIKNESRYQTFFTPKTIGKNIKVWLGTAWHELGHVLWSDFGMKITAALNLLEDARIEALLLKRFPKVEGSLKAMLAHELERGQKNLGLRNSEWEYAWVAGRQHLPKHVRSDLRKLSIEADGIDQIFTEYLALGHPVDRVKAQELAKRLAQLIGGGSGSTCDIGGGGLEDTKPMQLDVNLDNGSEKAPPMGSEEYPSVKERTEKIKRIYRDLAEELKEDADGDAATQVEVSKIETMMGKGAGGYTAYDRVEIKRPSPDVRNFARRVAKAAASFNDDSAKGLVRRRDSGRLKPMRFEVYDDLDTAYDMWEPGLSQEMDIYLVIDRSGSMRSNISDISYALEVGLADVANVTMIYYNDQMLVPEHKNTNERQVMINSTGSTAPGESMVYAHDKILKSSAANKLVVMYTDGIMDSDEQYQVLDEVILSLRKNGVNFRLLTEGERAFSRFPHRSRVIKKEDLTRVRDLGSLEQIVLDWTRTVLTRPV